MQYPDMPTRYIFHLSHNVNQRQTNFFDFLVIHKYTSQIKNVVLVNCVWGTWDTWATCSKTCGGGVQVRTRKVDTHEENGGTACSGLSTEQQNCNTGTCPASNYREFQAYFHYE